MPTIGQFGVQRLPISIPSPKASSHNTLLYLMFSLEPIESVLVQTIFLTIKCKD